MEITMGRCEEIEIALDDSYVVIMENEDNTMNIDGSSN